MHVQVLALADGLHHLADVDAVFDDRIADLVVLERELVADGDITLRYHLYVLVVFHDPALERLAGLDALHHHDADAVAFLVDHEMNHLRALLYSQVRSLCEPGAFLRRPVRRHRLHPDAAGGADADPFRRGLVPPGVLRDQHGDVRSEERRGGKECRSRWSP